MALKERLGEIVRERLGDVIRGALAERMSAQGGFGEGFDVDRLADTIRDRLGETIKDRLAEHLRGRIGEVVRERLAETIRERIWRESLRSAGVDGHGPMTQEPPAGLA